MKYLFFSLLLFNQIPKINVNAKINNKMDIGNIIFNKFEMKRFINLNFKDSTFKREDLIADNHSLSLNKFNMVLINENKKYLLFNLPTINLFAYSETAEDFCLYILMDLNKEKISSLIDHVGYPENVNSEDFFSGDFDFLVWNNSEIDLIIMKDRFQKSELKEHLRVIVKATNIKGILQAETRYLFK